MSAKTAKPGTPAAVVELFPRRAPVPRTLPDVLDRVFQLQYTSRLALDAEFFDRISHIVDLVARIDAALRPDSDIRDDPTYRGLRSWPGSGRSTRLAGNVV